MKELQISLSNTNWSQILQIDETNSFSVEFVIKNDEVKAIIFIDTNLIKELIKNIEDLIIFIDGTFATVPQLKEDNCQLWTIVIRYNDRVSKTI